MKKTLKKLFSIILTLATIMTMLSFTVSANAQSNNKIRVIVENKVCEKSDKVKWDKTLLDTYIDADNSTTVSSALIDAVNKNNITQTGAENGYITEIGGLCAYDGSAMSGWLFKINDWFTDSGMSAYTVKDGTLKYGDTITFCYSANWGEDIGCLWNDTDTSLESLTTDCGTFDKEFASSNTDYILNISSDIKSINILPSAHNKTFQVRIYKNEYTPSINGSELMKSAPIDVKNGDTIYIGVGNENWPSMSAKTTETVYKVKIVTNRIIGDVNNDTIIDINDVTDLVKYAVGNKELTEEDIKYSDFNNDNVVDVNDATAIQKYLANEK